jgi:hypothetical protein
VALGFDDILPYLASAYRRGVLVPFIGSGMSRRTCTGWLEFLRRLADEAGVEVPAHLRTAKPSDKLDTSELYRLADKAVLGLSALEEEKRAEAYRTALNEDRTPAGTCAIPEQTEALARCYWPLVLTTNYDDLYVVSRMRQSGASKLAGGSRTGSASQDDDDETEAPEVLGRGIEDCHKVIRSLEAPTRPILWALQGFLGGQAARPEELVKARLLDERRRHELAAQVVAGHQQYQKAVNAQPHFRRAFAEIFSRRSLLFLGSGLLEDYLVNLFGEIAHHYGPGPYPHFALFSEESRATLDARFLQMRLGIAPVFYKNHGELKELLGRVTDAIWEPRTPPAPARSSRPVAWMPDELGFSLSDGLQRPGAEARRLRLRYAPLSVPAEGGRECVIVSVGRTSHNHPIHGSQARGFLAQAQRAGLIADTDGIHWQPSGPPPSLAYRFGDAPLFAVAARIESPEPLPTPGADEPEDSRDLGIIPDAVCEALRAVDEAGFRQVRMGPVASGQYRLWHPLHPFVQTLAGIRRFFDRYPHTGIERLDLHVFSPAVWFPTVAGKVPVAETLSSPMMKIWVDIRDPEGASEIFAVTTLGPTPVGEIKKLCGLSAERWNTEILPRSGKVLPSAEDDRLVTPTSIVVFSPREPVAGPV